LPIDGTRRDESSGATVLNEVRHPRVALSTSQRADGP
jgi:hypothetical protein